MKRPFVVLSCLFALCAGVLRAETAPTITVNEGAPEWSFGGDLRVRWVGQGKMPNFEYTDSACTTAKHTETPCEDFVRIRTRLWGKVVTEELEAYLRVTNEFRYYRSPSSTKGTKRIPDVTFIDNLYVTFKDVADFIDVKIGRQDISFGQRRIIGEGTPMDGSRSCYFDAARVTFKFDTKRTLDALAIYMPRHDWMPTLGKTYSAKSKGSTKKDYENSLYDHNEYGLALYYQDRSSDALGFDLYYFFKGEEGEKSTVLNGADHFYTHTFGTRLLPKFSETLSGELELAVQAGDDNLLAMMAYTGLTYAPGLAMDPKFTLAAYYLSGDRSGRGKHSWRAVFNRETALGDLIGYMYCMNAHTNLFYPHVAFEITPSDNQFFRMHTGPLFAPVEERDSTGGTYGHYRGYYAQLAYDFAIGKAFGHNTLFEELNFGVLAEVMSKASGCYEPDEDHIGYYLQAQFTYSF